MALARIPPAALMRSGDPDDPRAQRTRAALLAEFERQLAELPSPPTVTSVLRGAAVSRSAFYAHFASIEDLHAAAVRQVLDDFGPGTDQDQPRHLAPPVVARSRHLPDESVRLPYEMLFTHIAAHRILFSRKSATSDAAVDQLRQALVDQCRRVVETSSGRPDLVDPWYAAEFVVGGVLACITRWLDDPDPCPAGELASQVAELTPSWLAGGAETLVEVALPSDEIDQVP